jgi:hypothetical protein
VRSPKALAQLLKRLADLLLQRCAYGSVVWISAILEVPHAKFDRPGLIGVANRKHKGGDIGTRKVITPLEFRRGDFVLADESLYGLFHPTFAQSGFFGRFGRHSILPSIAG